MPFEVPRGVIIPVGGYTFNDAMVSATTSASSGACRATCRCQRGQFYDGDIRPLAFSSGRVAITKQFSLEPSFSMQQRGPAVRRLHHAT